ncbi:MAG TPA: WecB/TagA/CpsF family glycosyltransferase [Fimbriimonas sp.]|nr:WecB/TagA/CpsF family glycosyltransferase [Fimbriimonas sp.]
MIMESYDNPALRAVINSAGLVTPDGMPVVWYMRRNGSPDQKRVCGPDLMPELLRKAERLGWRVGLHGGHPETLEKLQERLRSDYPALNVVYANSPPFRALTETEEIEIRNRINAAGVELLFVSLGCPKQEMWMSANKAHLSCVSIGVGAAFSFLAGTVKQAPVAMQRTGFEWLFRLVSEPKRLWHRYAKTNPRFMALVFFPFLRRQITD